VQPRPEREAAETKQVSYIGMVEPGAKVLQPPIKWNDGDETSFSENKKDLEKARGKASVSGFGGREQQVEQFLRVYFTATELTPDGLLQAVATHALTYWEHYVEARDLFIGTGDVRLMPAVVNEYIFSSFLQYSAGNTETGDVLTQDFLCILARTLNKDKEHSYTVGKECYLTESLLARRGLIAARELLLYARAHSAEPGIKPHPNVLFPSLSWTEVLRGDFVKGLGCNPDVELDYGQGKSDVNLYNLCRQLDNAWQAAGGSFPEGVLVPDFNPDRLGEGMADKLGIRQRQLGE
jgi:hypothetical protein